MAERLVDERERVAQDWGVYVSQELSRRSGPVGFDGHWRFLVGKIIRLHEDIALR
jgi:hypothetical protein